MAQAPSDHQRRKLLEGGKNAIDRFGRGEARNPADSTASSSVERAEIARSSSAVWIAPLELTPRMGPANPLAAKGEAEGIRRSTRHRQWRQDSIT